MIMTPLHDRLHSCMYRVCIKAPILSALPRAAILCSFSEQPCISRDSKHGVCNTQTNTQWLQIGIHLLNMTSNGVSLSNAIQVTISCADKQTSELVAWLVCFVGRCLDEGLSIFAKSSNATQYNTMCSTKQYCGRFCCNLS